MFTIKNIENEIIINKSKFITNIISVDTLDDINNNINLIKNKYKDATHHCYAYMLDNNIRFNDDGEPSGTAGMPILDSLQKNNLNHVLCIVTRYFGGVKLGAGGLVRAYSNSTSEAIAKSEKLELIDGYNITIKFSYDTISEIDNIIKNNIINKDFNDIVTYNLLVTNEELNKLNSLNIDITINNKIVLKK